MRSVGRSRAVRARVFVIVTLVTLTLPPLPGASGASSFALQFDAANQYVTYGPAPGLGVSTFTVETWFTRTGPGLTTQTSGATGGGLTAVIPLVAKGRGEADGGSVDMNYFLGIQGEVLAADFEEGAGSVQPGQNHRILGVTPILEHSWYHAAVTFDGTTLRLYLNGAPESEVVVGAGRLPRSDSIQHGSLATAINSAGVPAGSFAGKLDETRIWDHARSGSEISGSMDTQITGPASGLVARWGMDEGAGSRLGDSTGDQDGTAVGAPVWVEGFEPNGAPEAVPTEPADGALDVGASPVLGATVSDPEGSPLTVRFFGRPFASGRFEPIATRSGIPSGGTATATWAGLDPGQMHEWYATVSDGFKTTRGPTWRFSTAAGPDPVLVGAGDIAQCGSTLPNAEATGRILSGVEGTVFTAGDDAYPDGTSADFADCYHPVWGGEMSRTRPAAGNHEWHMLNLDGYFGYFGAGATDAGGMSYYSYDVGPHWHVVVLDSECAMVGGCHPGSPQEMWLRSDLQSNAGRNILAIWHRPLFSSGRTNATELQPLWDELAQYEAEFVLVGHDHIYERFAPLSPSGAVDMVNGIRQFTVGTGGSAHHPIGTIHPASEVVDGETYGVLKLTLHPESYDWRFLPVAGETFTDAGSAPVNGTANTAPRVDSMSVSPASPRTDQVVSAVVAASDPDGDAVSLSYQWQRNGADLPGQIGATLDLGGSGNGDRGDAIAVVVTASDGTATSPSVVSAPVTVVNSPPTATVELDDPTPRTDALLTAAPVGSDPDGDPITFSFRWKVNGTVVPGEAGSTLDLSRPGNGDRGDRVTVVATPSDGRTKGTAATDRATVANSPPSAEAVRASVGHLDAAGVDIPLVASDADGDPLTFSIVSPPAQGAIRLTGPVAHYTPTGDFVGGDGFTYRASDGSARSMEALGMVELTNASPSATVALDDPTPRTDAILSATAVGSDDDGDALTFSYGWTVNGTVVSGETGPTLDLSTPGNGDRGDEITVVARPSDGHTSGAAVYDRATVANSPPKIDSVSVDPTSPRTNQVVSAVVAASDPDGDALSLSYQWRRNGVDIPGENGVDLDLGVPGNGGRGDRITVVATADDGSAASPPVAAQAVTVANSRPTAGPVSASVGHLDGAGVDIALVGSDADGDPLTFSIVSPPAHGTIGIAGSVAHYTPTGDFVGGDGFTYRASDGSAASEPATALVDLTNASPTATVALDDRTPRTDAVISANATGSDGDGEVLTFSYAWIVNGTEVSGEWGPTLDLSEPGNGDRGDEITVVVTPFDGHTEGTPAADRVTVANSAPTATVALDDPTPFSNGVASASTVGRDADGDAVSFTYVWRVNGVVRRTITRTSSTTDAFDLSAAGNGNEGDTFTVEVTPYDGQSDGPPVSATGTVGPENRPPTALDRSVIVAQGGSRVIALQATDPENDPLTYVVLSGPSHGTLSGSGSTRTYAPAPGYTGPDAFTFVAHDGISAGNTATVTITVSRTFSVTATNYRFRPKTVPIGRGDAVLWTFDGSTHSVTGVSALGFLASGPVSSGGTYRATFFGAGTFRYRCEFHSQMSGSVEVPVAASPASGGLGTTFRVTWAAEAPPTGLVFDVQVQRPGSSAWTDWRTGQSAVSASFTPDAGSGTYTFRARIRNAGTGGTSDWSPSAAISVG